MLVRDHPSHRRSAVSGRCDRDYVLLGLEDDGGSEAHMASIGKDAALLAALVGLLVAQPLLAYGGLATRILFDGMFAAVLLGVVFIIFG